jgi:primosomal protein N' (replication factor Y)
MAGAVRAGAEPAQMVDLVEVALGQPAVSVIRSAPADTQLEVVAALARHALGRDLRPGATVLVIGPSVSWARWLAGQLRQRQHRTHLLPDAWASGTAGGVVVGARSAVWAPTGPLAAVVVLDEHDESLQEERNPTWHARDVAIERARRAGAPCVLISPTPSLVALDRVDDVVTVSRSAERSGWPVVEVVDRRDDEPGKGGLFSARLAEVLRSSEHAVAVLNRKGRAVMLACAACGELVRTEDGAHLMVERDGHLEAPATGEQRPLICATCGATTLKRLRLGVGRAAEELASLLQRPVVEWPPADPDSGQGASVTSGGVVIGTEAALHGASRVGFRPDVVAFLDFDQELHAPRYRAAEQALGLLVRAARLLGDRDRGGRILVQTRTPEHRVLRAAKGADPGLLVDEELALRGGLGFPPVGALAEVSGTGAGAFLEPLISKASTGEDNGVRVLGPRPDGRFLVRADDVDQLAEILGSLPATKSVRVAVDPPRA